MSARPWERWAPASGVVYAVLAVIGLTLIVFDEVDGMSDSELIAYYESGSNRGQEAIGLALVILGVLFFLLFVSTLWSRLKELEPLPTALPTLIVAAGVAFAALQLAAVACLGAVSTTVTNVSDLALDPDIARVALGAGFNLLYAAAAVMALFVIAATALVFRTSLLPRWLGWVGIAAVVLGILEALLLPVFAFPIWVVIVSMVLMRRAPARSSAADAT